ncbi:hypothetical protein [Pelomonas sp. SE-A7]|uniref:hypothetical protein n=1 Tax=Pelomonas sp. SE-A7 TaxID=3054953 RepID=UPI00259D2850|nr:hypothetical protein [Pelomonas sp. SE-A7]MDM4766233.1 hypothetical protein [Pelomonas sp. SE-A7]
MQTLALQFRSSGWQRVFARLQEDAPALTWYALGLLVLVPLMSIGWMTDERLVRGAIVWIKPIKFALAIALLALTTAWFIGHLPAAMRRGRAVRRLSWLLIASGSFEFGYILLKAAMGQGSHFNEVDTLHQVMYALMGLGALALTATQPALAWLLWRHPDPRQASGHRLAMLLGLTLTFALGAIVGVMLGNHRPPEGGLPVLGWVLSGGDLRPAHFVGIHAGQLLPMAALVWPSRRAVWTFTSILSLLFGALVLLGLS